MQANRRFNSVAKLASTVLVVLAVAGVSSSRAQTQLRPPVGSLGSTASPGGMNAPLASPARGGASGPASSHVASPRQAIQVSPTTLQVTQPIQVPLSPSLPQAPRAYVTTPVHPPMANIPANVNTLPNVHTLPGARTQVATTPNDPKVQQTKLPHRVQCLTKFYLDGGKWDARSPAVALTCELQDHWVVVEFVVPNKPVFDVLVSAQNSGFSLWIDYTDSAAAAEGNPKQKMMMVGAQEAYQSRMHVVCLPTGNRNQLNVGPHGGQAYPEVTTWCTDGKRVIPVTFASDKNSWGLLLSNVEDGALAIDYQVVMGGRHPKTGVVRPYPIESIKSILGKDIRSNSSVDPVLAKGSRWCRSEYVGPAGAAGCIGLTARSQMFGEAELAISSKTLSEPSTAYNTFFDKVAMGDSTPFPKSGGKYKKFFNYYILPGVVPPEFRNVSKGACRVALYRDVAFEQTSSGVGVGKATTDADAICQAGGNTRAVWGQADGDGGAKCWNSQTELDAENSRRYFNSNPSQAPKPPSTPLPDTCQVLQQ